MGGLLSMEYAACFPASLRRFMVISASGRSGPYSIAFRYLQRQIILGDPDYHGGWYYDKTRRPVRSMAIARQLGTLSYRSRREWESRFGRRRSRSGYGFGPDFLVETYLDHMGQKIADQFDANSFMLLTKAMDLYSLGYGFGSYAEGVARIQAPSTIVGVTSDTLFPLDEQQSLYHDFRREGLATELVVLESDVGHDAFLVEFDFFDRIVRRFVTQERDAWPRT